MARGGDDVLGLGWVGGGRCAVVAVTAAVVVVAVVVGGIAGIDGGEDGGWEGAGHGLVGVGQRGGCGELDEGGDG